MNNRYRNTRKTLLPTTRAPYVSFCLMKKARKCDSCQAHVIPSTTSCTIVHRTTLEFVVSDWSLNSASRSYTTCQLYFSRGEQDTHGRLTLWKTCSLRISCNLALRSLTFCTISWILPLSVLSMALVSPITRSRFSRMPPTGCPPLSQPPAAAADDAVKQILWSPESAALKVKRPALDPRCETTRWSLSKVSSTVMAMPMSGLGWKALMAASYCSAL